MSKSSEFQKVQQDQVEYLLKFYFGLTPADLKKECQVDFQKEWSKLSASFGQLFKTMADMKDETVKTVQDTDPKYGKTFEANCKKNEPFKKTSMDIIKTALPCAKEERESKLLELSKIQTCTKLNQCKFI